MQEYEFYQIDFSKLPHEVLEFSTYDNGYLVYGIGYMYHNSKYDYMEVSMLEQYRESCDLTKRFLNDLKKIRDSFNFNNESKIEFKFENDPEDPEVYDINILIKIN